MKREKMNSVCHKNGYTINMLAIQQCVLSTEDNTTDEIKGMCISCHSAVDLMFTF